MILRTDNGIIVLRNTLLCFWAEICRSFFALFLHMSCLTLGGNKPRNDFQQNPFDNWFTWCQNCKHGGHALHLIEWFRYVREAFLFSSFIPYVHDFLKKHAFL